MNTVEVTSLASKFKHLESPLKHRAGSLLSAMRIQGSALSVFLIDNRRMMGLNRQYRKKTKATNVLSFRASKGFVMPKGALHPLGEIYLAPDYIAKKGEDLDFMLAHGLLHLLGYDHEKKGDSIKMRQKEVQLMRGLGKGN